MAKPVASRLVGRSGVAANPKKTTARLIRSGSWGILLHVRVRSICERFHSGRRSLANRSTIGANTPKGIPSHSTLYWPEKKALGPTIPNIFVVSHKSKVFRERKSLTADALPKSSVDRPLH